MSNRFLDHFLDLLRVVRVYEETQGYFCILYMIFPCVITNSTSDPFYIKKIC